MGSLPSLRATGHKVWSRIRPNLMHVTPRAAGRAGAEARLQALRREVEQLSSVRSNVERATQLARVLDAVSAVADAHGLTNAELDALRSVPPVSAPRGLTQQLKQRATDVVAQVWAQGPFTSISELALGAAPAAARSAQALLAEAAPAAARSAQALLAGAAPALARSAATSRASASNASSAPDATSASRTSGAAPGGAASRSSGAAPTGGAASRTSGAAPAAAAVASRRSGARPAGGEASPSSSAPPAAGAVGARTSAASPGSRAASSTPTAQTASRAFASARTAAASSTPLAQKGSRVFASAAAAAGPRQSRSPFVLSVGAGRAAGRAGMQLIAASLLHLPRLHRQIHAVRRGADIAMHGAGFAMQGAGFAMQGAGFALQHAKLPRLSAANPIEPPSVASQVRASLPPRPERATATSLLLWSGRSGLQLTYEIASAGAQLLLRRYVLPRVLRYLSSSMTRREIAPARPLRPLRTAR